MKAFIFKQKRDTHSYTVEGVLEVTNWHTHRFDIEGEVIEVHPPKKAVAIMDRHLKGETTYVRMVGCGELYKDKKTGIYYVASETADDESSYYGTHLWFLYDEDKYKATFSYQNHREDLPTTMTPVVKRVRRVKNREK